MLIVLLQASPHDFSTYKSNEMQSWHQHTQVRETEDGLIKKVLLAGLKIDGTAGNEGMQSSKLRFSKQKKLNTFKCPYFTGRLSH